MRPEEIDKIAAELNVQSLTNLKDEFLKATSGLSDSDKDINEKMTEVLSALSLEVLKQNQKFTVELIKRVLNSEK